MERRNFVKAMLATTAMAAVPAEQALARTSSDAKAARDSAPDREYWCDLLYKIAKPVLSKMSKGMLRKTMTVELSPAWDGRDRAVTYMECFGRLMAGLSPWLTLPDDDSAEGRTRKQLHDWAQESYAHSVNPKRARIICCGARKVSRWWTRPIFLCPDACAEAALGPARQNDQSEDRGRAFTSAPGQCSV
jgi:hypothetical protein